MDHMGYKTCIIIIMSVLRSQQEAAWEMIARGTALDITQPLIHTIHAVSAGPLQQGISVLACSQAAHVWS